MLWKKASSYALFCAVLAASVAAQNTASASTRSAALDVLITLPVQVDGSVKNLQLMRGETIEDAAVTFARNNGLLTNSDAARVRAVVDQLSGMLRGHMEEIQASEVVAAAPKPTVQVSMPLTINGETRDFQKMEGESVEVAVERFLYAGGYSMDFMRELYPQIVEIALRKVEELKPARKELFSFTFSVDGREATARHFESGDPMEEARETFRVAGFTDAAFIERFAPQIAEEITRRVAANEPVQEQPVAAAQPPAPERELFSLPLTLNERPTILVHYEGYTSRESAARYLNENGLASSDADGRMMGQVVQIIDNRVAEIAQEKATQEAATRAVAEARAAAEEASRRAAAPREPLARLSINLGNNQEATLEYFEGDSIERTVELFLRQVGMQEGPSFDQSAVQLVNALREQVRVNLAKREEQAPAPTQPQEEASPQRAEPYVQLPVTLSGRVFDMMYYEGEQPGSVANKFCVEKHEQIRAELGLQFDGDQLLECKNLLEKTLQQLIAKKQAQLQQQQPEPEQVPIQETQQAPPPSRGEHLVSLDIDISGSNTPLHVYQNDDPEQLARAFCEEHNLDFANVGPLAEGIKEQLSRFK